MITHDLPMAMNCLLYTSTKVRALIIIIFGEPLFICSDDFIPKRFQSSCPVSYTHLDVYKRQAKYRAVRCEDCPLRCRYFKAKENRTIEQNHRLRRYRQKAKELLLSLIHIYVMCQYTIADKSNLSVLVVNRSGK